MKKLINRFLGVVVVAALLMGTVMPNVAVMAKSHPDHANENNLAGPDDGYTITLTTPKDYKVAEGKTPVFGAYQIFSGKVQNEPKPDDPSYTNPGTSSTSIPITDIKWGNAFITKESAATDPTEDSEGRTRIVKFVYELANASKNGLSLSSAFRNFEGFSDFAGPEENTLAEKYYEKNAAGIIDNKDYATVKFDLLATDVADVISKHPGHEWLQAFTDILGGYGENYEHGNYVKQCYDSKGKWDEDTGTYTMHVPAGYYMVLDMTDIADDGTNPDEAYSARMMFVAENIKQTIKEDVPQLDKTILRDKETSADAGHETDVAGVGDVVTYKLTGSLPSNYDYYTLGYKFEFVDTLSKGLTLENYSGTDVEVEVKAKGWWKTTGSSDPEWVNTVLTIDKKSFSSVSGESHEHIKAGDSAYTAVKDTVDEKDVLTVTFPCLREIVVTGDGKNGDSGATYRLGVPKDTATTDNKPSEIYVTYKARINENAVVIPEADKNTPNGNNNTATLTYSNNPQSYADNDKTTPDGATVYTFGLDIVKVDAAKFLKNEPPYELAGAEFALVRPKDALATTDENTEWEIAKLEFIDATNAAATDGLPESFKNGYYTIKSWELISGVKGKEFVNAWLDGKYTVDGYRITTKEKGSLNVSGLDVNVTYTMVETATPDDTYAKIDPFTITLTPAVNGKEYTGKIQTATTNKAKEGESFSLKNYVEITDPTTGKSDADGSANMLVANFKYIDLPSTGGIGIYPFYIIGGIVVAGSIILFALSRRKKTA